MTAPEYSDFVIVGGVAAGPKTAATLARRLPGARITLFERGEFISYAGCGLPYFASGDVESFAALNSTSYGVIRDVDFFRTSKGFTVLTRADVVRIDRKQKCIYYRCPDSGSERAHGYGKLVLATGATAARAPFPVPESPLVRPFVRPQDALFFRSAAESGKVGKAAVIGAGLIGCEVCEATKSLWGIDTVLLEKEKSVLPGVLDPEMASLVEGELLRNSISVRTGAEVREIVLSDQGLPVIRLSDGEAIDCDIAFCCLGVRPETSLARECGLAIGSTGAIVVDSRMRTSDPDIYAGGDCVESVHRLTGRKIHLPMGSIANRQGRVIAENLAGGDLEFSGVLGTFIVKVFDLNVGGCGLSGNGALSAGFHAREVWGSFTDRPDYYPDSKSLSLKMVYHRRTPLGIQAVGQGSLAQCIDVFSSLLQRNATLEDFFQFEQAYAPPYGEALDPLHHMAALAIAQEKGLNVLSPDMTRATDPIDMWLDVRQPGETSAEPWAGTSGAKLVCIPLERLRENLESLERSARIAIVCKRGPRAYQAALILKAAGFEKVAVLGGGTQAVSARMVGSNHFA